MDNEGSQQEENEVWFPTQQLQEEREQLLTTGTKISPEFTSEPFSFQKDTFEKGLALSSMEVPLFDFEVSKTNQSDLNRKWEKSSLSTTTICFSKQHRPEEAEQEETNALSHHSSLCTSQTVEDYMCPLDLDEATNSENDDFKNSNLDTCSTGFSQASIKTQNVGSSTDIEQGNEPNLLLWTLRETQIQQILTVPHSEHCPLYSYSKCKTLGIDFNVGSGVKQNFDQSKFLTNGIMLEINTLAEALGSVQKDFITEILEYNFHLNFKSELCRTVFAQCVLEKFRSSTLKYNKKSILNMPFELPDTSSIGQSTYPKGKYCLKCHKDRNSKLVQDPSDPLNELHYHPHSVTDTVFAEANCSAQKPTKDLTFAFHAAEEKIMNSYPLCKKIGLSLCVDKDKPRRKLDQHVLTRGVIKEVAHFAKRLCGTKNQLMKDVLEHNFNIDIQCQDLYKVPLLNRDPAYFSDIFVIQPYPYTGHRDVTKWKEDSAIQKNERKEMTKKRKLALLTKKDEAEMLREDTGAAKAKKCKQSSKDYPICKVILLKLDLENLTTDIHIKSQPSCLGNRQSLLPNCTSPTVKFNVNPSFVSQSGERRLFGTEEKTEIRENVSYKFDMEEEEMETESNMWKLRANRVQQIVLSLEKEYCTLKRSKRLGLEYNVGHGPKQNFSVDSLNRSMLLEIAKFALAMNSSQEYFIIEILENNFDHRRQDQKKSFASELMNRVRWLKNCEDAVKLSKEVFELPNFVSSVNVANRSVRIVNPEFSSMSRTTECDVAPTCSSDPHAETKEHRVNLYPFCKDIGLKLNVISSQENKKLEINKLTNGAMTEVTKFAEKLCGTFDQICLDILRHNFDLGEANGDSDLAEMIIAQIPVIMEQKLLAAFMSVSRKKLTVTDFSAVAMGCKKKTNLDAHKHTNLTVSNEIEHTIKDLPAMKEDCQNNSNSDTCSTSCSQVPINSQNVGSSTDIEQDNETNLLLWTLRETQIQRILTVPHGEHCPFYSYSRCKKLGIDFNVGSGIKQKFDQSKLLTNGIMLEISTLAAAVESAQKDFITEILEYNFHLNLNNEVFRSVFAQCVFEKVKAVVQSAKRMRYLKMPFELPDTSSIDQSTYAKGKYCPKCHQNRNSKLFQDTSDPLNELHHRSHSMTDRVFAEANCSAQKPTKDLTFAFQAAEEKIMSSYPLCKKIGLSLCVDKDKPRRKLDQHVLTRGVIKEVAHFAKRLCGTKSQFTRDVLEHNFNIAIPSQDLNPVELLQRKAFHNNSATWFNDIFVIQPLSYKSRRDVRKWEQDSAVQKNERKESAKKRKLALLTKKEKAAMLTDFSGAVKARTPKLTTAEMFPLCSKIGLDLDVTSKSGQKEKLDLELLTTAVVTEIYKFLLRKPGHYYPDSLYDILDYNFDISSQNYRRWEFSIASASKVKIVAKTYQKNLHRANKVFKLPFVFEQKESSGSVHERQNQKNAKLHLKEADMTENGEGRAPPIVSHACLDDVQTEEHLHKVNEVLKMPSVIEDEAYIESVQERQNKKTGKSHQKKTAVQKLRSHSAVSHADLLNVNMYKELWMGRGTASPKHPGTMMQMTRSLVSGVCDSPLQENIQIKEDEDDSHYGVVKSEPVTSPESDMTAQQLKCCSDVSPACLVDVQTKMEAWVHEEDIKSETYPETIKQLTESPVSGVCDGPLQKNIQIKEDEDGSHYGVVKPEPVTEEISEPMGSLGSNLFLPTCPSSESNIKTESEKVDIQYYSLAGPEVSEGYGVLAVCPNIEDVKYEILVESADSQEFFKITTHQDTDSTVKIEQENVPVVFNHYDVV